MTYLCPFGAGVKISVIDIFIKIYFIKLKIKSADHWYTVWLVKVWSGQYSDMLMGLYLALMVSGVTSSVEGWPLDRCVVQLSVQYQQYWWQWTNWSFIYMSYFIEAWLCTMKLKIINYFKLITLFWVYIIYVNAPKFRCEFWKW